MKYKRASGVLLHPTSLPGSYGIGEIGPAAYRWLEFLSQAGCGLWQVLPLGPTGYGDSPYQSFSAFAGNPFLISVEILLEEGLLKSEDLVGMPRFSEDFVDFGAIYQWKLPLLNQAYTRFQDLGRSKLCEQLEMFKSTQAHWLDDFALFMAIKESLDGAPWSQWPLPLRLRDPKAIDQARKGLSEAVERQIFRQYLFFLQWNALRKRAAELGIQIIGDIPIFVAHDSSDVWAHPDLFYMDEKGQPTVVAGVPPDYFSPTGQLWGNPLYRWELHAATGYAWWKDRLRAVLQMVDIVRLDHFRGFAAYWEVPAGNPTAEIGQWVDGPGVKFFQSIQEALGDLPIIAEDLGVITPDVVEMRERFNLPGMKICQFAFSNDASDPFLPHNYPVNCMVYTGTHDNDTVLGWFKTAPKKEQEFALKYLDTTPGQLATEMIRALWMSVAVFSLAPIQDFLSLGPESRMNFPGQPSGNWTWRVSDEALSSDLAERIRELNILYFRTNARKPA